MTEYTNSAMHEAIEECVHNDMHRAALRLRLLDGWTYERIAEEVNRTPRQVYNIMDKYTPALFDYIGGKKKRFF